MHRDSRVFWFWESLRYMSVRMFRETSRIAGTTCRSILMAQGFSASPEATLSTVRFLALTCTAVRLRSDRYLMRFRWALEVRRLASA